mgnify:CR=1 FL=1
MARLPDGELEAAVMDLVWDRGGWITPGEVHVALVAERPLAYTTVMTILVRLWQKGRVERQREGRGFAYRAVQTREEYTAGRMRELLEGVSNRRGALSHLVSSLAPADRAQLRRLLQRGPRED